MGEFKGAEYNVCFLGLAYDLQFPNSLISNP